MKILAGCIISLLMLCVFIGCDEQRSSDKVLQSENVNTQAERFDPNSAWVSFDITVDKMVYENSSNFGEPPQMAIWLENPDTGQIKTVWVSYRSGSGDWAGKVECPVALSYWFSRFNKEMGTSGPPSFQKPAPIAITGATPETDLHVKRNLGGEGNWQYFVEVNVSADFNRTFSSETSQGMPDPHGNGQPSLIYKGFIDSVSGKVSKAELIGRTEQFHRSDKINTGLEGITTAKNLLKNISVSYHDSQK